MAVVNSQVPNPCHSNPLHYTYEVHQPYKNLSYIYQYTTVKIQIKYNQIIKTKHYKKSASNKLDFTK